MRLNDPPLFSSLIVFPQNDLFWMDGGNELFLRTDRQMGIVLCGLACSHTLISSWCVSVWLSWLKWRHAQMLPYIYNNVVICTIRHFQLPVSRPLESFIRGCWKMSLASIGRHFQRIDWTQSVLTDWLIDCHDDWMTEHRWRLSSFGDSHSSAKISHDCLLTVN